MFVLDQTDSYFWPVSVDLPINGTKKTFTFDAEFKRLPEQDVADLRQRYFRFVSDLRKQLSVLEGYSDDEISTESNQGYEELCDEVICGWGKVSDAAGDQVDFTEASKRQMYRVQGACVAILKAWFDSIGEPSEKGAAKAGGFRAKNS